MAGGPTSTRVGGAAAARSAPGAGLGGVGVGGVGAAMAPAARAVVRAAEAVGGSRAAWRGGTAGLVGAAVVAGLIAERRVIRRHRTLPDLPDQDRVGPIGGRVTTVVAAADGVPLHVEETAQHPAPGGADPAPVTLVFVHGFCVTGDSWVLQQRALRDLGPMVFYDQRAHGRSGPSEVKNCTIDQLAADLHQVLTERVPEGPVVLVGHSMGGMTVLGLADAHPELFGDRVVGVVLLATSAGDLARVTFGLPAVITSGVRRVLPGLAVGMRRAPSLLERARRRGSDLSWELTRRIGFGSTEAPPSVVSFLETMVADTPMSVVASFLPTLLDHDKLAAAAGLRDTPTVLLVGDGDLMTPLEHSRTLAEVLPDAELRIEEGAGHAIMLERPAAVNDAIRDLVGRTRSTTGDRPAPGARPRSEPGRAWTLPRPSRRGADERANS